METGLECTSDADDPIAPTSIQHSVDEIWADHRGGSLEQRYDFLDYHFEAEKSYCRARVYMDEPRVATLFGPFAGRRDLSEVQAPQFEADVLAYLDRRFGEVRRLRLSSDG